MSKTARIVAGLVVLALITGGVVTWRVREARRAERDRLEALQQPEEPEEDPSREKTEEMMRSIGYVQ